MNIKTAVTQAEKTTLIHDLFLVGSKSIDLGFLMK